MTSIQRRVIEAIPTAPAQVTEVLNLAIQAVDSNDSTRTVVLVRALKAIIQILSSIDAGKVACASSDFELLLSLLEQPAVLGALSAKDPLAAAKLRGLHGQLQLLDAEGGCVSAEDAGDLIGIKKAGIHKARAEGRLLGLPRGQNQFVFPVWQFYEGRLLKGLKQVYAELDCSSWMKASFMLSPNTRLNDETPLARLRRGDVEKSCKQLAKLESTELSSTAEPPSNLHRRRLPIVEKTGQLWRISSDSRGAGGVIYFSKNKTQRFDDPDGKFGVCYLGEDDFAAFIEVFGQAKKQLIALTFIHDRAISVLIPSRTLRLVDITAQGAAWIGAAGEVSAGDHMVSQRWSRALYLHPENVDGIYYRCRHDLSRMSVALFDKEPKVLRLLQYKAWSEPTMQARLGQLLDHYRFALV